MGVSCEEWGFCGVEGGFVGGEIFVEMGFVGSRFVESRFVDF